MIFRILPKAYGAFAVVLLLLNFSLRSMAQTPGLQEKPIQSKVVAFSNEKLQQSDFQTDTLAIDIKDVVFWDEADQLLFPYVRSLGQMGKPAEFYQFGTVRSVFRDIYTGLSQPYLWDITQKPLFINTKTPFIRANFSQGAGKMQNLGLILSRNINPFWNVTLQSKRRTVIGNYQNNVTDHWNILLNSHYQPFNKKLWGSFAMTFQELKDNLNGGTYQDSSIDESISFEKLAQPVLLNKCNWTRLEKSIFTNWYFLLAGDSIRQLRLYANAQYQYLKMSLLDEETDSALIAGSTFHNPFGGEIPPSLRHEFESKILKTTAGLLYKNTFSNHSLKYNFENQQLFGNLSVSGQSIHRILHHSNFHFLHHHASLSQSFQLSNLFAPSNFHELNLQKTSDSSSISWKCSVEFRNENPSLRDRYTNFEWFRKNGTVKNQQKLSTKADIIWKFRNKTANFSLIYQQLKNFVYFDTTATLSQLTENVPIMGSEISFQIPLKIFYMREHAHGFLPFQKRIGVTDFSPNFINQLIFGYEKKHFQKTILLRGELIVKYMSSSQAFLFGHSNLSWYPVLDKKNRSFLLMDFWVSARFKRALLFFRMNNLLDGVLSPGNYTTLYHPAMQRNISLGISWDFVD